MTAAITLDGVTNRFGTVTAVDDLNLEFRQDVVTGLLGRNGAGKTVTLTGSRERVDALLPGRSVLRSTQVGAMRTVIVENSPGLATQAKAAGLTVEATDLHTLVAAAWLWRGTFGLLLHAAATMAIFMTTLWLISLCWDWARFAAHFNAGWLADFLALVTVLGLTGTTTLIRRASIRGS